jgi:glycosyltransferase involved in cell wall biosynthesis
MSTSEAVVRLEKVLVADVYGQRFAEVAAPGVAEFTERHRCDLLNGCELQPTDRLDEILRAPELTNIALVATFGLPGRRLLSTASRLLRGGKRVYVFWPEEHAIEVVDRHRLASYWRHCAANAVLNELVKVPQRVRRVVGLARRRKAAMRRYVGVKRRMRQLELAGKDTSHGTVARLREGAIRLLGEDRVASGEMPSRARPIEGSGAYVRLDYWARLTTGGSYGHTCFLAKAAADVTRDFQCIFANRFELLDRLGVEQHVLPHDYPSHNAADLIIAGGKFDAALSALLDAQRPSYVYERIVVGSSSAAEWCARTGVPYIVEYNGSELAMARSFGKPYEYEQDLEEIESFAFSVATLINVISEPVAQSLAERGISREKILVNPNAVDPNTYKPLPGAERAELRSEYGFVPGDIVIGFCGTFGGWHGIEVLAAAIPRVCREVSRAKFLLIGNGNLKPLVHEAVATHGIADRVVDLGLIPQLEGARAMAACDILLAPHAQKIDGREFFGSPTKLFEYMAVGSAIVSSDLAQLGEVMRPALTPGDLESGKPVSDQRGVLVEPGSVDQLVNAVIALAARPGLCRALGQNGRAAVIANYTWDIHVENIWRHMAGQPPRGYMIDRGTKRMGAGLSEPGRDGMS